MDRCSVFAIHSAPCCSVCHDGDDRTDAADGRIGLPTNVDVVVDVVDRPGGAVEEDDPPPLMLRVGGKTDGGAVALVELELDLNVRSIMLLGHRLEFLPRPAERFSVSSRS